MFDAGSRHFDCGTLRELNDVTHLTIAEVRSQIAEVKSSAPNSSDAIMGFYLCNLTSDLCNCEVRHVVQLPQSATIEMMAAGIKHRFL